MTDKDFYCYTDSLARRAEQCEGCKGDEKPDEPSELKEGEENVETEGGYYYPLFKFFSDAHELTLLDSEIQDIITVVLKFEAEKAESEAEYKCISCGMEIQNYFCPSCENERKFPYDYKSIPLEGGGHATVTGEVTPEIIDALNAMVEKAKELKINKEKKHGGMPKLDEPILTEDEFRGALETIEEERPAEIESRLATLQAENEKLWKLLEEKVKFIEHETCLIENEQVSTMEINKRKDRAWAAFQKANDLTQNKK